MRKRRACRRPPSTPSRRISRRASRRLRRYRWTSSARMMNFVAGAEIPERYVPFLREELALEGSDVKSGHWAEDIPASPQAILPCADHRRRHVGHAGRHPPEAGGHPLHHRRQEQRSRRHLVREHLSRLPRRQPEPPLFLLVRAQLRLAAALFDAGQAPRLFPQRRGEIRHPPAGALQHGSRAIDL